MCIADEFKLKMVRYIILKSSLKHKCWTIEKQLLVMDKSIINERPNCFESINEKLRSQRSMYKQMMGEYLCKWFHKVHKKKVEFMKVCFLLSIVQSLTYLYTMGITFFLCSVACKAARVWDESDTYISHVYLYICNL